MDTMPVLLQIHFSALLPLVQGSRLSEALNVELPFLSCITCKP